MSEEFMRGNEEVLAATHPRPPMYLKQEGAVRHATAAAPPHAGVPQPNREYLRH